VFPATSKLWLNDTGDLLWKIVAKHLENLSSLECFFEVECLFRSLAVPTFLHLSNQATHILCRSLQTLNLQTWCESILLSCWTAVTWHDLTHSEISWSPAKWSSQGLKRQRSCWWAQCRQNKVRQAEKSIIHTSFSCASLYNNIFINLRRTCDLVLWILISSINTTWQSSHRFPHVGSKASCQWVKSGHVQAGTFKAHRKLLGRCLSSGWWMEPAARTECSEFRISDHTAHTSHGPGQPLKKGCQRTKTAQKDTNGYKRIQED
jgi:hypothetical protein